MTKTFSFQQIAVPKVLSEEVREAISNNVLQFYVRDQQQEAQDEGITALYERLSQEDKLEGESNSIANQKKILERYCREHGITAYRHYDEDDGYSGTNFNRPGFQRMLADIKAGKIKRVIVKDMSRFGRDYLQVGFYTDMLFPDFGVHFIAVNDGVDSTRGENEFTAIRNVFNEMYARDTSKKIRATWQSKGKSGEHLTTIPPYGYMKDPDNKKKWIIDEEAAAVVQQIFALCVSGMGPTQICHWLEKSEILNPTFYWLSKGIKVTNKPKPGANPYKWTNETVSRMLEKIEYLGHTVNFKTRKQSYKSKKKLWNDPSEWVIFENTQPPIVEESVFLIVQNIRKSRRRPTKMGDMGIFSGLLYCAECGGKMYQCRATNFTANLKLINDTMLTRPLTEEKRKEFLQATGTQLDKLDFLIQGMVKTSRLETGVITLEKQDAVIGDTLVSAINGVLAPMEQKEISLSVDCPSDLTISHDSRWTSEALFNILDNAVKYTSAGGSIQVRVRDWEMYLRIDVTDTGRGIPEHSQGTIFKRFYRDEAVHDIDGVGIGLYLAREIITMQGGYITVESKVGEGSTFSVFLPIK